MAVPYTFANATVSIPLSQLDSNFATAITLGNTAIQLGNTVTTLNNMTLSNVTVSSGNVTITNVSATTANVTNLTSSNVTITGGTIANVTISGSGSNITATNINASNVTVSTDLTLSGGTANGVAYLNGSKVLTTGSALTFDGTNLVNTGRIKTDSGSTGGSFDLRYGANTSSRSWRIQNDSNAFGDFAIAQSTTQTGSTYQYTYYTYLDGTQYWSVGGSEQMRLTSTGLGIGTSSPTGRLSVTAAASQEYGTFDAPTSGYAFLRLRYNGTGYGNIGQGNAVITGGGATDFGLNAVNNMLFASGGITERMRLDTSGNLGLGVTPSAWGSGNVAIQLFGGSIYSGSVNNFRMVANAYSSATGFKYVNNGYATYYSQNDNQGSHIWQTAPSGTAGNAITFTQAMTLDASSNLTVGNVLYVNGSSIKIRNSASNVSYVEFEQNGAPYTAYSYIGADGRSTGYLNFSTANVERMRIDSSGNLLVGTTSSFDGVTLAAGKKLGFICSGSDNGINFRNGGGTIIQQIQYSDIDGSLNIGGSNAVGGSYPIKFSIANTECMRIDSSGNVGIGTSSPNSKLAIGGSSDISFVGDQGISWGNANNGSPRIYGSATASTGYLAFKAPAGSEAMRIDYSGNLLVGTTTAGANGLTVTGLQTGGGSGIACFINASGSGADGSPPVLITKAMTTTSSSARFVQFYASGGSQPMGGIVGNGATNVQFASISDAREKTNIEPMSGSLDKVLALKPVSFDWLVDGSHVNAGFVAQDVQQVFPEFVVENMSNDGEEERLGLTGGMTGGIIAHLVKAIQELKAELDATKAEVAALKAK